MLKVENVEIGLLKTAIEGMRNPMESWDKSDTEFDFDGGVCVGANDIFLAQRLCKAGPEHRKFMRQIMVGMRITAPQFWWSQFDTYKVGPVRDSCSKMHTIHVHPFTADMFAHEGIDEVPMARYCFKDMLNVLETMRNRFNDTKDKKYWRAIIELLPEGFCLRSTVSINYENALNIIKQRKGHKVEEWDVFIDELLKLPFLTSFLGMDE